MTDAYPLSNLSNFRFNENKALIVGTVQDKFRDEFLTFNTTDNWTVVQTGAGQTISVAGNTGGARYLNIASGVTANSETIIQSKDFFKAPFKLGFAVTSSQAIANQEFHVELVEVDETGSFVADASVFSAPTFNNARNGFGVVFDGVSQNNARYKIRSQGVSELVPVAVSFGTNSRVAGGTTPDFTAQYQIDLLLQTEIAQAQVGTVNATAARTLIIGRTDYVPNPDRFYAVRIRCKNLAIAPASTTDWRLHFVRVIDASRVSVDFGMIGGSPIDHIAAPVKVTTMPTTAVTLTNTALAPNSGYGTATFSHTVSAATTNATSVKATGGSLNDMTISNNGANPAYVKLYNKASAPTVGTDTPVRVVMCPAGQTVQLGFGTYGLRFATGIAFAITGGAANNDTTAVAAAQVIVGMSYT